MMQGEFQLRGGRYSGAPAAAPRLTAREAAVDALGCAVIPEGTVVISSGAFQNRQALRRVKLPASVRTVEANAFAQCPNLMKVQLNEGLETLGAKVFFGCDQLRKLALPDSLRTTCSATFDGLSLRTPIFNRKKTVLYRYYGQKTHKHYVVPPTVRRLAAGAFSEDAPLEVQLPQQLETIDPVAFHGAKIRHITLPAGLKKAANQAFWRCSDLERLEIFCGRDALRFGVCYCCEPRDIQFHGRPAAYDLRLCLLGLDFLNPVPDLQTPQEAFWQEPRFSALAARCAQGDSQAMLDLAEEFAARSTARYPFYTYAANFWRYRASLYGNSQAEGWKDQWLAQHLQSRIPAAMPSQLHGNYHGRFLRAMGFGFFNPKRSYHLDGMDGNGLVEVSSWCGEDGADADGFGGEDEYDWWLLDEFLQELPGIAVIHGFSRQERRAFRGRFDDRYDAALQMIRARRKGADQSLTVRFP